MAREASVDAGAIAEAGYAVTEMLAGCACCTLIGQLVPAIRKLVEELSPDLVILEATGMATPGSMRDNIERYGGCPVRIAALVDASRWRKILTALRILLEGQVEPADVICVNKCDLVDEDQLAEVERTVRDFVRGSVTAADLAPTTEGDPSFAFGPGADIQFAAIVLLLDACDLLALCKTQLNEIR